MAELALQPQSPTLRVCKSEKSSSALPATLVPLFGGQPGLPLPLELTALASAAIATLSPSIPSHCTGLGSCLLCAFPCAAPRLVQSDHPVL
ncbi:unnamed protein product [Rangifer tarandus platyrhynchus]|uniref:Uncharacterized protein n=1 Tax=Rangifer tarandus platyrhynchus TaxID=3082113 RepID=A0AC59ZGU7_RANTA